MLTDNAGFGSRCRTSRFRLAPAAILLLVAGGVSAQGTAPSFTSMPVTSAIVDAVYIYSITTTDPDPGEVLTIEAAAAPDWLTLSDNGDGTATLTGTPGADDVGIFGVILEVTDSTSLSAFQSFAIDVSEANEAPFFTTTPVTSVEEGEQYDYDIEVDDDGGDDDLTIEATVLPGWLAFEADDDGEAELRGTPGPGDVGEHPVELVVTDEEGLTGTQSFTITVSGVNAPPSFTSAPVTTATEGAAYSYAITTTDPDPGDRLTITAPGLPGWLTLDDEGDGTASLTGTPGSGEIGDHDVTLRVTDVAGLTAAQTFTITVANANAAPSFTSAPVTAVDEGSAYSYTVVATDPDAGDVLSITAPTLPGWLSLDDGGDGTASLTGTPRRREVGQHDVTLQVSDDEGLTATQSFTITVGGVNEAPAFTSTPVTSIGEGEAYGYAITATDADGDPLEFSAPTLPGWLDLTDNGDGTASLAGTPSQADVGSHPVAIAVTDGTVSERQEFTVEVVDRNDAPEFTATPPQSASEDTAYSGTTRATDPDGDPLTITAPVLPSWLTFDDNGDGTATLTGEPTVADLGSHDVELVVTDEEGLTDTAVFAITVVAVNDAPVIGTVEPQTASENVPFELDLTAFVDDEEGDALAFTASGLPDGLALDAGTGIVSGIPALGSAGDYDIDFTVSDDENAPVGGGFVLTVLAADRLDLALAIDVAPNPVEVNGSAVWTFTVTNNAPLISADGGARIEATFTGDVPLDFEPPPAACTLTPAGGGTELVCTTAPIAGGAVAEVTLTSTASRAGDVFVEASVAVNGAVPIDDTVGNDAASASLSIAQSVSAEPAQSIGGVDAMAAASGDLDGDGHDDLAVATAAGVPLRLYLNVVDAQSPGRRELADIPIELGAAGLDNDVAIADLDLDGDPDIVTARGPGSANAVFENAGDASFTAATLADGGDDSRAVAIGDIDGDGFPDVVFANAGPNALYRGTGAGTALQFVGPIGGRISVDALLADLVGADGLPELVIANADGDAEIFVNTGGALGATPSTLRTGPTTSVAAEDLNGDGRIDLVFGRNAAGGSVPANFVFLNTSGAALSFSSVPDRLGASSTSDVLAADTDLEGDADLVFVNSNGVHQLFMNSAGSSAIFVLQPTQLVTGAARAGATGQLSADDRIDLAVVGADGINVFYNDGEGRLGLGDVAPPTLTLVGPAEVSLDVGEPYNDAGATAADAMDGDLTPRIETTNPVDTSVIGTYMVRYDVTDLSGNPAAPLTRTVRVGARENVSGGGGGGGGGAFGLLALLLLLLRPLTARARSAAR